MTKLLEARLQWVPGKGQSLFAICSFVVFLTYLKIIQADGSDHSNIRGNDLLSPTFERPIDCHITMLGTKLPTYPNYSMTIKGTNPQSITGTPCPAHRSCSAPKALWMRGLEPMCWLFSCREWKGASWRMFVGMLVS